MIGEHAFVDETKNGGLVVVSVAMMPARLEAGRAAMRGLLMRGQSHLHFTKERDDRRRQIIRVVMRLDIRIDVYDTTGCDPGKARDRAMESLVANLAVARAEWLVIERDESLEAAERKVLAAALRQHGLQDRLRYRHVPKRSEPLLWAADAAAWCWTHRGWRDQILPKVGNVIDVT